MTNAARSLATLLEEWNPAARETIFKSRGGNKTAGSPEFWRRHGQAVSLLLDLDAVLADLADSGVNVEKYENRLPAWYSALFLPQD